MIDQVKEQKNLFENIYSSTDTARFDFHITNDPLTRYLRDRRLEKGLEIIKKHVKDEDIYQWKVLIVCGGVGGEGIFFKKRGFNNVTVSDISGNSLSICNRFDPTIKTTLENAEEISSEKNAFDLVVVQDGLHHLPRPVSGFTEMLRVAAKAVIVIEPHAGLVGSVIGTEWETHEDSINYVFRWNRSMVNQVVKSYFLKNYRRVTVLRFWDHNVVIRKIVQKLPKVTQVNAAKFIYSLLGIINFSGNMMVAVILK